MQHSSKKNNEESHTTLNTTNDKPGNNSNLVERKPIEGTPFTIIKQIMDNDKPVYFLVMGEHRLTELGISEEEILNKLITEHWKIITTVVAIIVEKTLEIKKPYEIESL